MTINRDTQRKRVYTAEKQVFSFDEEKIENLKDLKSYIESITKGDYYRSCNGWKRIRLGDGRGARRAFYYSDDRSMSFPRPMRMKWVAIHELSHMLSHKTAGESVGHHATFCTHYANLVSEQISVDKAKALIQAFDDNKVLYRKNELIF